MTKMRQITVTRIIYSIYDGSDLIDTLGEVSEHEAMMALHEACETAMMEGDPISGLRLERSVETFEDFDIPDEPYERMMDK